MKLTPRMICVLAVAALAAAAVPLDAQAAVAPSTVGQTPAEILAQSDARRTIDDLSFLVRLTSYDGSQVTDTKTLWGSLKRGDDHDRVLMYFAEPASDRGRKLLVDGDAVYLLFVRTTNPIRLSPLEVLTGQASDGDVIRTFSRDYDVQSMTGETRNSTGSGGENAGASVDTWHFSLSARPSAANARYARVELWVEKSTLRLLNADFYAASGALLKKASYRDYRTAAGKDFPFTV
ncbi:MAG TPA: outer membrane lipoprotein-sorting protein, partial [bacterium]|nr:outer membrane lipoprotein-sorting protein [bacterium]